MSLTPTGPTVERLIATRLIQMRSLRGTWFDEWKSRAFVVLPVRIRTVLINVVQKDLSTLFTFHPFAPVWTVDSSIDQSVARG